MIGSGLRKLAKENGMRMDHGIAYGNLRGYAASPVRRQRRQAADRHHQIPGSPAENPVDERDERPEPEEGIPGTEVAGTG